MKIQNLNLQRFAKEKVLNNLLIELNFMVMMVNFLKLGLHLIVSTDNE